IKTRYPEGQKSSNEQKKRTVNDEPTEESVLFDESNEGVLISSIDESGLKGETTLPASKKIIDDAPRRKQASNRTWIPLQCDADFCDVRA
ncbi:3505_t:CDS:2, partial [Entrophospora sp. SA101]